MVLCQLWMGGVSKDYLLFYTKIYFLYFVSMFYNEVESIFCFS